MGNNILYTNIIGWEETVTENRKLEEYVSKEGGKKYSACRGSKYVLILSHRAT